MGRGLSEPQASSEMDDNSLSPEACYECKINGYPKRGRKRRDTNDMVGQKSFCSRSPIAERPSKYLWLPGRMLLSVRNLPGEKIQTLPVLEGSFYEKQGVGGTFWRFLLLFKHVPFEAFHILANFLISPQKSNKKKKTLTLSLQGQGLNSRKASGQHSAHRDMVLPSQESQVLKARGSPTEKSYVEWERSWSLDKNNMGLKQPGFFLPKTATAFLSTQNCTDSCPGLWLQA